MAKIHRLPVFPSTIQIFRGGPPGTGAQVYSGPGEKVILVRSGLMIVGFVNPVADPTLPLIYVPKGTDVRGVLSTTGSDIIQWAGNPNWLYTVNHVDDVAADFSNQFRVCFCTPMRQPTPLP